MQYVEGRNHCIYETVTIKNFDETIILTIRKRDLPDLVNTLNEYWRAHKQEFPDALS